MGSRAGPGLILDGQLGRRSPTGSRYPEFANCSLMVCEVISINRRRLELLLNCLLPADRKEILNTKIILGSYLLIWDHGSSLEFTCRSAWDIIRARGNENILFKDICHSSFPVSISMFFWRLIKGWISVDEVLQKKGMILASKCQYCKACESQNHVFISSQLAAKVWETTAAWFPNILNTSSTCIDIINEWKLSQDWISKGHIRLLAAMWYIWWARNEAKYNNASPSAVLISRKIEYRLSRLVEAKVIKKKAWKGEPLFCLRFKMPAITHIKNGCKIIKWLKPDSGWVKLNTYGASKGNPGMAGGRGVLGTMKWRCSHILSEGNKATDLMENKGIMERNIIRKVFNDNAGLLRGITRLDQLGLEYVSLGVAVWPTALNGCAPCLAHCCLCSLSSMASTLHPACVHVAAVAWSATALCLLSGSSAKVNELLWKS